MDDRQYSSRRHNDEENIKQYMYKTLIWDGRLSEDTVQQKRYLNPNF